MSECKNCKCFDMCGDDERKTICKGKILNLNIQQFGSRGAYSSSKITPGSYSYKKNGMDLNVNIRSVKNGKIIGSVVGKGANSSFFDSGIQEIPKNSPLLKGMKRNG